MNKTSPTSSVHTPAGLPNLQYWTRLRRPSDIPAPGHAVRRQQEPRHEYRPHCLLDDVASLAKAAAASLDDIAGQAAKAGTKAAGVVIDDTAVTPRYLTDFAAARELPVVGKIALGSLKNKLLFLLPAALALSLLAPHAIMPLLMLGGLYLCYEGTEKVYESLFPHAAHEHEAALEPIAVDPQSFEIRRSPARSRPISSSRPKS